jgi:HSP20 family protein
MFNPSAMFDTFFADLRAASPLIRTAGKFDAIPAMDVYRRDRKIIAHVDLPGVAPEDVSLEVENGWVVLTAERTYSPEPGDSVYLAERPFGKLERRFKVASGISAQDIAATFTNGVLTVSINAPAESTRTSIEIKTGNEG